MGKYFEAKSDGDQSRTDSVVGWPIMGSAGLVVSSVLCPCPISGSKPVYVNKKHPIFYQKHVYHLGTYRKWCVAVRMGGGGCGKYLPKKCRCSQGTLSCQRSQTFSPPAVAPTRCAPPPSVSSLCFVYVAAFFHLLILLHGP